MVLCVVGSPLWFLADVFGTSTGWRNVVLFDELVFNFGMEGRRNLDMFWLVGGRLSNEYGFSFNLGHYTANAIALTTVIPCVFQFPDTSPPHLFERWKPPV